jgi:hypothetical protein
MPEPLPEFERPPRPPTPPAPPSTGGPSPDPSNPGPPIEVRLGPRLLGDLGNSRVDARMLHAILLRDRSVADWLRRRGVTSDSIREAFPDAD